ncbi:translation initiation factor IF-2 [Anaerolinea thermophila]|uniref:translation initiation factor IF-2 n=1 Tax=Anaerolinea thermophila TaxID=167964 RepID=UPI0026EC9ED8|nr:translation initiation factor IF-2 [Anaerolinea thermophila]
MSDNGRKKIELPMSITVRELAQRTESSPIQVIKILMSNGVMANINQQIDFDTAAIVVSELGFEVVAESMVEEEKTETGEIPLWRRTILAEKPENLIPRPPVVTILGHVDHGKTTLLDAIRNTNVAEGEAGGITQHIGAYQVEHKGRLITFLDTPGHAAFTAMRARGAQGADIVILVVAANDGVMPQTREAIAHARAARVPIVVALNKIDRPDANPDFVKRQLAELDLVPDEWGGNTLVVPVSAKQRIGLEDLMEAILLTAEGIDIRANPKGKVIGTVVEAQVDKSRGPVATLLVQNGTLEVGDIIVAGTAYGKLRAMFDFRGRKIRSAGPSTPVQVMGLSEVPEVGELFTRYASEREARAVVEQRKMEAAQKAARVPKATLEELFSRVQAGEEKELRLILKVDVQGSLEPIINSINDLPKGEIKVNILHAEAGNVTDNDVLLASASKAIILGFNVQAEPSARRLAEAEGVSIRLYDIIYRLTEDLEKALKGMLEPATREVVVGKASVLAVFTITKVGNVAGCRVTEGEIRRNGKVRVFRNGKQLFDGEIASLKIQKDDVREVRAGYECGIGIRNFNDIQPGDVIECYIIEKSA